MRLHLINIFLISIFILIACESQLDMESNNDIVSGIVVEGIITNENKPFEITLTEPIADINGVIKPISNAEITILIDSVEVKMYEKPSKRGVYRTLIPLRAFVNRTYTLHIQYNEKQYSSKTLMIPVSKFVPLSYYLKDTNTYVIHKNFASKENAMWEISYNWDFDNNCDTCMAKEYFYSLHSLDVSQIFSPSKQQITFPKGTKIIQKKYSLTESHAAYIRKIMLETQWNGWFFDENSSQIQGNVSGGGLGYFGACSVLTDTIAVQ